MQKKSPQTQLFFEDSDQGQRDDSGGRGGLLPGSGRHHVHSQRWERGRGDEIIGPDHAEEHAGYQDPGRGADRPRVHQQRYAGWFVCYIFFYK